MGGAGGKLGGFEVTTYVKRAPFVRLTGGRKVTQLEGLSKLHTAPTAKLGSFEYP